MQDSDFNKKRTLTKIAGFIKPFKWLLIWSIVLNTVFSIFSTISIALIKPIFQIIFDTEPSQQISSPIPNVDVQFMEKIKQEFYGLITGFISSGTMEMMLIKFSILIISIFILKNIFKYWSSIVSAKLEEGIIKYIRDTIFGKLITLSMRFFSKNKQGNLISIIANDVTVLTSTTTSAFTIILREAIQVILFLFLLVAVSPMLTLIAFSTSILSLFIIRFAMKFLKRYASRMQTAMADYTSTLQETISGIRVVKAYNAEGSSKDRFNNDTDHYVKSSIKHRKIISMIPAINEIFAITALAVVLFVGGLQVLSGDLMPDDLMLFLFSLFAIMSPITTIINNVSGFQRGIVAGERIFTILDQDSEIVSGIKNIERIDNKFTIDEVDFSYEDAPVVRNVNFNIKKGQKVAFVGASGSGKSTMLDLIIRFYDPQKGKILLDGTDIKEYKIEDYRALFGIVSQETMLFNDTVANNIRYGKSGATEEKLIECAKIANAYNFISALPKGFDTIIGDRGVNLSGGERQRVAIARALLHDPQILIFDEATSALDAESEKIVQKAINESLRNRTAILVAHRLSTIIDCDVIFVFDHGKIVEQGSHSELLLKNGVYKKLYDIQFAQEELDED